MKAAQTHDGTRFSLFPRAARRCRIRAADELLGVNCLVAIEIRCDPATFRGGEESVEIFRQFLHLVDDSRSAAPDGQMRNTRSRTVRLFANQKGQALKNLSTEDSKWDEVGRSETHE